MSISMPVSTCVFMPVTLCLHMSMSMSTPTSVSISVYTYIHPYACILFPSKLKERQRFRA